MPQKETLQWIIICLSMLMCLQIPFLFFFLDVWIQQQQCRRSTWKMMSSCNRQARCNEAGGGIPTFCSTTGETCQCGIPTTVAREPWTCMNPCSSAVDVLWSSLVVAWCVVACCHHLLEWMRNTWEEMYSQRRTVLWSNVSFCHEGLFSVDSTVDQTPLPL